MLPDVTPPAAMQHRPGLLRAVGDGFFQAAFETMRDPVAVCDPQGRITLINAAMERFAGLPPGVTPPEAWSAYCDLFGVDGRPVEPDGAPLGRALRGEAVEDVEFVVEARSGRRRTMVADARRLFDEGGALLGAVVICHDVTEQRTAERLILEAETAMRRARQLGTGRPDPFDRELQSQVRGRMDWEESLRLALLRGELRIDYQPKVSLLTDRTTGVEALLRWDHPVHGLIAPVDFIPLAEETGLIIPIGAWVLETVCREARRWATPAPGALPLTVAVNVSPRQFESGLAESFGAIIARTGIDPRTVCLEVTEGMVMRDYDAASTTLRALKALGLKISIDDFGTGFSSLAYLKRFPLDELKIDRSLVDGLGRDSEATAIVAAVMGMAHALDLRVVAEGVETGEQAAGLRTLGCDEAQGFFYARPGPAGDVDRLLHTEAAAKAVRLAHGPGTGGATPARAERILVVDDAADVRRLARSSLAAAGYDVRGAGSGEEALLISAEFRPDAVVLDVNLPGISGLDVCRALRGDTRSNHITIVMLTADNEPAEKVEAFAVEADDYMVKPFSPRDLVSRVAAALRRRHEIPQEHTA